MVKPNDYGTQEIQNELLDIMKLFHGFCQENDISYFLFGGSCLGAVRHEGFIPWDDDLDICVDRDNYNKLLRLFSQCNELKMHQTLWIKRIQKKASISFHNYTPTLDVFVIDNAPDNKLQFDIKILRLAILQGMLKDEVNYKGFSFIYKAFLFITHIIGYLFSENRKRKWYDKVSQIGNAKKTKMVHCSNDLFKLIGKKYSSDVWKEKKLVPFEDTFFFIPVRYDEFLRTCYGNYMEMPDKEHRRPEHVQCF